MAQRPKTRASLEEALQEARRGDRRSLFAATEVLRPYLHAVATQILGGRLAGKVEAADVVQQSLVAAIERFEQFQGEGPEAWQAWLVAIVRNESRNLLRYWHQDRRRLDAERPVFGSRLEDPRAGAPQASAGGGAAAPRLALSGPTPSGQLAARQQASQLLARMGQLPEEQRRVLYMRHFEGLSHGEIAARMNKSAAAVRQLWVRALKGLREQLLLPSQGGERAG